MPRVPTYDEFQVAPQVTPTTRVESSVTPQMMSVSGEQLAQMGRGMQSAGDAFSKIAIDVQKDINDAVTKEADNQAAQTISKVMGSYMNSVGKDAVVNQDGAKKAIEDALRTSGEGLQNNMQRQMYGDIAMRRMQSSLGQINLHAANQAKQWSITETEARMHNARADAEGNWSGWNQQGSEYQVKRATMLAETDALMKAKFGAGPDDDVTKAARLTQTTGLAANTVQGMLVANQSRMAKEYFDDAMAKGEIDPSKAKPINDMIKSASVKDEALLLSMNLKGGFDSKLRQLDALFEAGTINADVHDAAGAYVKDKWQTQKTMQAEHEKSVIGKSTDWFVHNQGKTILDFQTANPVMYESLKNSGHLSGIVAFAKGNKVDNNQAVWADVMTNQRDLKDMTPTQIFNKYGLQLDESHLEKLYGINAALNGSKDEQHLSIFSTAEMVKDSAVRLKILPATGKPSDNEATSFNKFQLDLDARIASYEDSNLQGKRKATQQELKKILGDMEMDQVFQHRSLMPDRQMPMVSVKPEDMSQTYVKVGNEEVYVASIPVTQRAQIIPALRKAGKPITEQNIADFWVRGGKLK